MENITKANCNTLKKEVSNLVESNHITQHGKGKANWYVIYSSIGYVFILNCRAIENRSEVTELRKRHNILKKHKKLYENQSWSNRLRRQNGQKNTE